MDPSDLESEGVTLFDPVEWVDSKIYSASEPYPPSELEAGPDSVSVSVRCSSDWEAATTPDATFLGVALTARVAQDGVEVPGGTYSGSCLSSQPMTRWADRAKDFDRLRA